MENNIIHEIGLSAEHTISSLKYARYVQDAILHDRKGLKKMFGSFCILYRPKNILSGDFYFYTQKGPLKYLAVCDCTGHGISGALLSILGHNMLEKALNDHQEVGEILNALNVSIKKSFSESPLHDEMGMDISLVCINEQECYFDFATANQTIFYQTNLGIAVHKNNRKSIGGCHQCSWKSDRVFYQKGDRLFLFSDGLPDQFGELTDKKYSYARLRELVERHAAESMVDLTETLNLELNEHQGSVFQTDDILFLGITL